MLVDAEAGEAQTEARNIVTSAQKLLLSRRSERTDFKADFG